MKQRTICLQPPPQPSLDASPDASRRPTGLCSIFLALALLLNLNSWADTPEEQGFAIATESDRRDQGWRDSTSELTMVLRNSHGEESVRSLRFRTLEVSDDGDKLMMIFDRPADVNGTVLLTYSHKTTSDDQWLFLPALKRVKRISSSNKSGPFIGSEFAYEDLASQELNNRSTDLEPERATHSLAKASAPIGPFSIDLPCDLSGPGKVVRIFLYGVSILPERPTVHGTVSP